MIELDGFLLTKGKLGANALLGFSGNSKSSRKMKASAIV